MAATCDSTSRAARGVITGVVGAVAGGMLGFATVALIEAVRSKSSIFEQQGWADLAPAKVPDPMRYWVPTSFAVAGASVGITMAVRKPTCG